MNALRSRTLRRGIVVSAIAAATLIGLYACAVTGVGVGVDGTVGVGYVGGYYEPCCYDYGGWGGGYHVGPWGHGGDHGGYHPGGGRAPAYRPAPAGRSAPSIPGRSRGH
jgi:hypothetical protein